MYAPYHHHYAYHDPSAVGNGAPPPQQPQQYVEQPHYMSDPNVEHHHHHLPPAAPRLPSLQMHHAQSKLRRRDFDSPIGQSSSQSIMTANMTPEEEAAAREEARKARKREMGRERQRRKRLRDKAKREAEKGRERMDGGHMSDHGLTGLGIPYSRSSSRSSLSISSYDSISSSASSSYSSLPPIAMNIAPGGSYPMSAGTPYSDSAPSPAHSYTSQLSGFSDASWNEHTAVFGNLSLSGDQDATVRAKHPRNNSAAFNITGSRRTSDADYGFGDKRRKSEEDEHSLSSIDWGRGGGGKARRSISVPEGIVLQAVNGPSRSPSPPPPLLDRRHGQYSDASPEGMYFANNVVQGLNNTPWGDNLQTKLGIHQQDLDRMSPEFAGVYDKWRVEAGMTHYFLDPETRAQVMPNSSSSSSPQSSTYPTPGQPRDRPMSAMVHPETPQTKGTPSTSTSPVMQTPAGQHPSMFPPAEYGQQWSATAPQLTRTYDSEWRGNFGHHTLSSPMGNPKDTMPMPPAPAHGPLPPQQQQHQQQQPQMHVQTGFVNQEYQTPAGPRSGVPFTPVTPVPQRGHQVSNSTGNVQMFYNPQYQQPLGTPVQASPTQPMHKEGDMFLQQ